MVDGFNIPVVDIIWCSAQTFSDPFSGSVPISVISVSKSRAWVTLLEGPLQAPRAASPGSKSQECLVPYVPLEVSSPVTGSCGNRTA